MLWTYTSGCSGYIGTYDDVGTWFRFPFKAEISALTDDALSPGFSPQYPWVFILSLRNRLVRWYWSATGQQEKQIKSLEGTWEGKPGTPKKKLVGERQEGSVLFQSGCGSRGLCRGTPFSSSPASFSHKGVDILLLPHRGNKTFHLQWEDTQMSLNTFLTAVWESTALTPLLLQSWREKKLEKSFVLLQRRERANKKAPENSFPTVFFYFKARKWHKGNDCFHTF